jgi:signal transduction histidine kinase
MAAPMLHKQKLDSLGTLATGVAHEINNPIQGIMNYAVLLKREAASETSVSRFADEIACESKRVADIVQSLLRFGRAGETAAVGVEASVVIDGALTLTRSSLVEHGILLSVHVEEGLPHLTGRIAQLQQVLMNFITNARDALVSRDGARSDEKRITIEASRAVRDGDDWWMLTVTDTGDGFDPSLSERIFDPFFTTKGDVGTGLGLSVSQGIVQAHGGKITCETEPGRGAAFCVAIPCHAASSASCSSASEALRRTQGAAAEDRAE